MARYNVVDNAPNWLLRTKVYTNKGQAYFYAKILKRRLPLGYTIHIDELSDDMRNPKNIAMFYSIGNNKGVKVKKMR